MNTWREKARAVIAPVIAANIGQPRKVIRKALRAAFDNYASERTGYAYKAWCDEVAFALLDRSRRPGSRPPAKPLPPERVLPSMREWARNLGQLEVLAVLDVDLMESPPPDAEKPFTLSA